MSGGALHLRRENYHSMPWRNGGGMTLEIAREPPEGSEFLWRLSVATVTGSGPFSNFTGYRRSVTLIAGAGFRLDTGGEHPVVLNSVGATASFSGAASTRCALINGVCSDLSLMIREPGAIISVIRIHGAATRAVPLEADALKAVFCLAGGTRLRCPDTPIAGGRAAAEIEIAAHDTVLVGRQVTSLSVRPATGVLADLLLLTWKPASAEYP
jgi:uncharacterized protein